MLPCTAVGGWLRRWGHASPRLICFSVHVGTRNTYVLTHDLERSDGSVLSSPVGVCWKRASPPEISLRIEGVLATAQGEQKTCRR